MNIKYFIAIVVCCIGCGGSSDESYVGETSIPDSGVIDSATIDSFVQVVVDSSVVDSAVDSNAIDSAVDSGVYVDVGSPQKDALADRLAWCSLCYDDKYNDYICVDFVGYTIPPSIISDIVNDGGLIGDSNCVIERTYDSGVTDATPKQK